MNRTEVKNKLRKVIIKMSSNSETCEIPDPIMNDILQYYGCTVTDNSRHKDDLEIFLKNLQKYIESTHRSIDDSTTKNTNPKFDLNLYEKHLEAETEYCEVTLELVKLLEEAVKYKETYSENFKDECKTLDTTVEVLNKKCQFLKFQCLLKLYGEENTLKGHLALRDMLKEELSLVKEKYEKAVDRNKHVSKAKDFEKLSQLFKVYKDLKNMETAAKMLAEL